MPATRINRDRPKTFWRIFAVRAARKSYYRLGQTTLALNTVPYFHDFEAAHPKWDIEVQVKVAGPKLTHVRQHQDLGIY